MKMDNPKLRTALINLVEHNGRPFFAGGTVRDHLLRQSGTNVESKDVDVEVFGLNPDQLKNILSCHGNVEEVGKSFGVFKLYLDGVDYDFSLPRRDNRLPNEDSHNAGWQVDVDPFMNMKEACSRRDYTVNSMLMDPFDHEVFDFFDAQDDLNRRILRMTSDKFDQDILRVLRGFQFAGRFDMKVEPETAKECRKLLPKFSSLSLDRVRGEFFKWALKSVKPSAGLQFLVDTGWSQLFPEFHNLLEVKQNPVWHPEVFAGLHTMYVCDEAVELAKRENLNDEDRLVLVFSALLHDSAKFTHSQGEYPNVTSRGHDHASVPLVKSFFNRLGVVEDSHLVKNVCPLTFHHMAYLNCQTVKAVRKLAEKLEPSNMFMLSLLVEADHGGRHPLPKGLPDKALRMLELSRSENVVFKKLKMLVTGKHLRDDLGLTPTKVFGDMLKLGYEAQVSGEFSSVEDGLVWFKNRFNL